MTLYQSEQNLPRCHNYIHRVHSSEQNVPEMTSYKSEQTCRDDFLQIGAELAEMTLYQSEQNLPRCPYINRSRLISLHTYFMVAGALTKNCFNRILRYLSSFAASSMPSCSTDVTLHHTNITPRVYTLPWPNQPIHQAPLRRLKTASLLKP
jgi:hypothetical protein